MCLWGEGKTWQCHVAISQQWSIIVERTLLLFSLFLWVSGEGEGRGSSNLRDSFMMIFCPKQQHFTLSSAPAHHFFQVWSLTRQFEPLTLELWLPLWCHFSSRVHVHNHLAMKCYYYARLLNLKYSQCLKRAWSVQWFFSQCCIQLLRMPVRTDLLLCDRWQNQLKHASAAKRSDINKNKKKH